MASSITSLLQSLRIVPMAPQKINSNDIQQQQQQQQQELVSKLTAVAAVVAVTAAKPMNTTGAAAATATTPMIILPEITLDDVADHDTFNDCWIVIYDRVYNVTKFLRDHPGGEDVIMDHAGRDATLAFHGTGHSRAAIKMMREYLIGELPVHQRIFRTTKNQVFSMDIPE